MGEALLKLDGHFRNVRAAERARDSLTALVLEDAEVWWQDHRDTPAGDFWPEFRAKFPLSCAVLACASEKDRKAFEAEPSNGLAGLIDWRDAAMTLAEWKPREEYTPEVHGTRLTHQAVTWYHARWAPLAAWLIELGAIRVNWSSPSGDWTLTEPDPEKHHRQAEPIVVPMTA